MLTAAARDDALDLIAFVDASPSPYHACATAASRLEAAGFTRVDETSTWRAGGHGYLIRGGSLVAWAVGDGAPPETPFRIIGAHTDSPNLRIKPQPDVIRAGVRQLAVEVYGAVLLNSWLDRDLGLSGRVVVRDGDADGRAERLVTVDQPVLRIPQLAIHLDREIGVTGLQLNPQQHVVPVWGLGTSDDGRFRSFLAKEVGVDVDAVLGWDVMTHDVTPGCLLGPDDEFVSSGRLDNLCSAWAGAQALVALEDVPVEPAGAWVSVVCLFDHEEVGSSSSQGADSPLLPTVLERLVLARGGDREAWHRAMAGSVCVSSDMAHATHPNYSDRHEPSHWISLNGGPVVKSNVNQRYATDAAGVALFADACDRAGVPVQHYVHRTDLPCGSTIGPITAARLGVPTVDVGAPQLAMHSARELMGSTDPSLLRRALTAFLTG